MCVINCIKSKIDDLVLKAEKAIFFLNHFRILNINKKFNGNSSNISHHNVGVCDII